MRLMNAFSNTMFKGTGEVEAVIRNQVYKVDINNEESVNKLIHDLKTNTGLDYKVFKETRGNKNTVLYQADLFSPQGDYLHYIGNGNDQGGEIEQPMNCSSFYRLFSGCKDLIILDLSKWDTTDVVDMSRMFAGCESIISLNVSNWDTSAVTDMSSMFEGCELLDALGMDGWNTSNVTDMYAMFSNCVNLSRVPCQKWDIHNVKDRSMMFYNCNRLEKPNWDEGYHGSCPDYYNEEEKALFSEQIERAMHNAIWG